MAQARFVGDGQFVGDGGATLQRLWEFTKWRMIKGCPGRYVIKHKKTSPVLVDSSLPVTALDAATFLTAALGHVPGGVVYDLRSERCVDRAQVVVFPDSGGIITYCKQGFAEGEDAATSTCVYVHTLNTSSGLQRKLEGLRLDHVLRLGQDEDATMNSLDTRAQ